MDIFYFAPSLLSAVLPRRWRCFQIVPPRWWLCFQIVPPRCQIYFQTAPHNKTCWWKVESREFVFSIRKSIRKSIGKSIGKSIRKSDSTTRSVRPILWTQAVADAVHMYTSTAFSISPPIYKIAQAIRNHRTIIVQFTMQLLRKHRTLNLSPKCKHRANIVRSICRQSASTVQASYAQCAAKVQALYKQSVAKAQIPCKQHPFCRLFCAFPCRICLSIQVLALSVAKTAKFYRFFTAIGFDAAGASPPVLS